MQFRFATAPKQKCTVSVIVLADQPLRASGGARGLVATTTANVVSHLCNVCASLHMSPIFYTITEGRQVRSFTATPSSLQTGDVPAMSISFTLKTTVPSNGTLTLAVSSTSPVAGVRVFVNTTPADASVVLVGLPNCSSARGAIDAATRTLVITLPSTCVLNANVPVRVEIPSGFFAPNPAIGTTVVLSLATSTDPAPLLDLPGYTIGMLRVICLALVNPFLLLFLA